MVQFWDRASNCWVAVHHAGVFFEAGLDDEEWGRAQPVTKPNLDRWSVFLPPRTFEYILGLV